MTSAGKVHILLVEDGKFFRSVLKTQIEKQLGFKVLCAETYAEACEIIQNFKETFFLALVDLNLPDSPKGEILEYVCEQKIPSIVFSGQFNEDLREHLTRHGIIDYVVKDSPASIDYVISTIHRLHANQKVKVLLVDDSKTARYQMCGLLERYKFKVIDAENGVEALKVLDENPDIKLVIADYNMPELDGFELTKKIRTRFSKKEICIIGVSTYGNHALSAKFIKVGANDFINKPFLNEEFFCRISQNLEMLEHIQALQNSLITDYLTGLKNRRYLFERGRKMQSEILETGDYLVAAMIDIDHFKMINDTYGHDQGDDVLCQVAKQLKYNLEEYGIVARFGGEEFCCLMVREDLTGCELLFEEIRNTIERQHFEINGTKLKITISIGVSWQKSGELDELIKEADIKLYEAKAKGRNKVILMSA